MGCTDLIKGQPEGLKVFQTFQSNDKLPYDAMIMMTANFNETLTANFEFTLTDIGITLEEGEKATITDLYGVLPSLDITDVNKTLTAGALKPHSSTTYKIQVYPKPEEVLFMQD